MGDLMELTTLLKVGLATAIFTLATIAVMCAQEIVCKYKENKR